MGYRDDFTPGEYRTRHAGRELCDCDQPCVRCEGCGAVDHAARFYVWDDETNSEEYQHECAHCRSDRVTVVEGGPCQTCFRALALDGTDYCRQCLIDAGEWEPVGDWERTVREITLAQAGVR